MLLGGLWHGANWTFVFWGVLHGSCLAIHKFFLKSRKPVVRFVYDSPASLAIYTCKVAGTFIFVLFAWLFFRSPNFSTAFFILKKFVFWESGEFTTRIASIVVTYGIVVLAMDLPEYILRDHTYLLKLGAPVRWGMYLAVWAVTLLYMFQQKPMPFIYFQF